MSLNNTGRIFLNISTIYGSSRCFRRSYEPVNVTRVCGGDAAFDVYFSMTELRHLTYGLFVATFWISELRSY